MTPDRWRQIEALYQRARAAGTPEELAVFLAAANPEQRRELETLLAAERSPSTVSMAIPVTVGENFEVGHYRIESKLGEGGMGVVYRAQQLQPLRRDVALKIIKPGMDSKQVIARFESERQALAMMDHPNIARVFDAGTTAMGLPYFVMEFVEGIPITRYCDSQRSTIRERIELFIPVCQAIQHAHQKGIIHRDIKPSNILVKHQEQEAAPKVIDFGLAKALGQQLSHATMMTNLGTVVGTLQYMSPEQAEMGRRDIDTRSDVYSLGAVLYELLTGTTPLEHERLAKATYMEALQCIREEETKPPSTRLRRSGGLKNAAALRRTDPVRLPKLLDRELDWIAMKALEKDRTRRYETVNGLVRDLQRYLDGEPVEAAPPSAAYRMGKFVRKHRAWLGTATAFTAVLMVAVVVSVWMAVRATRAEQEARAISDFLQNDLLAQASARNQARSSSKPDPDLRVRTALDRAAARVSAKFEKQPLLEASIRQTIGNTYTELGLYTSAVEQLERALALRTHVLGGQHLDTVGSMNALATAYERQGKYAQAEPLYVKVLEARRRALGEDNPRTLETLNGLATVRVYQGKYDQGEALFSKLLEAQRRVLGEKDSRTFMSTNNLAVVYQFQGKYSESEALFTRLYDVERRVLGEDHPDTLRTMVNLAEVYGNEAKYDEAEPLYIRGLALERRVLGDEHSSTLYCMNSLAELYENEGKYGQAESLFTSVLEIRKRVFGEENPFTLASMNGLAETYRAQGKYMEAETFFSKALNGRRRVLGAQHPDTLRSSMSLGRVLLRADKYADAEATLLSALSTYEKTGTQSWERYSCEALLGASLAGQKKYTAAESALIDGYEGLMKRQALIPAEKRESIDEARRWIAALYLAWGKPEKAAEWRERVTNMSTSAKPR